MLNEKKLLHHISIMAPYFIFFNFCYSATQINLYYEIIIVTVIIFFFVIIYA